MSDGFTLHDSYALSFFIISLLSLWEYFYVESVFFHFFRWINWVNNYRSVCFKIRCKIITRCVGNFQLFRYELIIEQYLKLYFDMKNDAFNFKIEIRNYDLYMII